MFKLGVPAVCGLSVTNVCNAACDFGGFARDKTLVKARRYVHVDAFGEALPILYRRGIRYITLQGESLSFIPTHRRIDGVWAQDVT